MNTPSKINTIASIDEDDSDDSSDINSVDSELDELDKMLKNKTTTTTPPPLSRKRNQTSGNTSSLSSFHNRNTKGISPNKFYKRPVSFFILFSVIMRFKRLMRQRFYFNRMVYDTYDTGTDPVKKSVYCQNDRFLRKRNEIQRYDRQL